MSRRLSLALLLWGAAPSFAAAPPPPPAAAPAFPLAAKDLEDLLQKFVDRVYLKGFRHLGDERDFDHGHILCDAASRPLAILYHTQELAKGEPAGSPYAYLDPARRNWLQWLDDGRIEDAAGYRRVAYPSGPSWNLFRMTELPGLDDNGTILDRMLEPSRVPLDVTKTAQWVFTRVPCGDAPPAASLRVVLPDRQPVCLSLSAS